MNAARKPRTALIGAGGLGRALLPGLTAAGYPVVAVVSRSLSSALKARRGLRGVRVTRSAAEAARGARLVLLAVPDRELHGVCRQLAREIVEGWSGRVVLHHAGALGLAPLRPLARRGASVGLLHPLQSLGVPGLAASLLPGSYARIEGDVRAVNVARRLARHLGLIPLPFRRPLSPAARAAYHAAASLAANDLVALMSLATRLLAAAGLGPEAALQALLPLARGSLAQIEAAGLADALTGPVVRGDAATLSAQLRRMASFSRDGATAHRMLSRELLRLAVGSGRLTPERGGAMERLLRLRQEAGTAGRPRSTGV